MFDRAQRISISIIGFFLIGGCLAFILTHNKFVCHTTFDDGASYFTCATALITADSCPGAISGSWSDSDFDSETTLICPWSGYVLIISYISLGFSFMFFVLIMFSKRVDPFAGCFGAFGLILLIITFISMVVEIVGGAGYTYEGGNINASFTGLPYFLTELLIFLLADFVGYGLKRVNKDQQESESLPVQQTQVPLQPRPVNNNNNQAPRPKPKPKPKQNATSRSALQQDVIDSSSAQTVL